MQEIKIKQDSYDNYIISGEAALKKYYVINNINDIEYENFKNNIKNFKILEANFKKEKKKIVNEISNIILKNNKINFIINNDGLVEYSGYSNFSFEYFLYKKEKEIMKKSEYIVINSDFGKKLNNKDKTKKIYELFHLLVYFNIKKIEYEKIEPCDPGDFIVTFKNTKVLYELSSAFGYEDNEKIEFILNNIRDNKKVVHYKSLFQYKNNLMADTLLSDLNKKNEIDYDKYKRKYKFSKKILLIATIEYDNCPLTGPWFVKFLDILGNYKSFDKICLLDYNSNCKDEPGPNVVDDFILYYEKMRKFYI